MSTETRSASPFDESIRGFLTAASSAAPTPGGGSVAALVAALGASMTSMVANLTQGPKFPDASIKAAGLVERMQRSIAQFESLLEADVASFNGYMAALKLPKATDADKSARREALENATIDATRVPLSLAQECLQSLELTRSIAQEANPHVLSDLGIAAMLLDTAGQSALLTADINIPSIRDEAKRAHFLTTRNGLGQRLVETRADVMGVVRDRMAQG